MSAKKYPSCRMKQLIRLQVTLLLSLLLCESCNAFTTTSPLPQSSTSLSLNSKRQSTPLLPQIPPTTHLYAANQFDLSKPTFDLLSFRPIRSDALLRYNSLNQSEPLRINLFLLMTVSLLGYPLWCESVTGELPTAISSIGACAAGLGCGALFNRERTRGHLRQIYRYQLCRRPLSKQGQTKRGGWKCIMYIITEEDLSPFYA